MKISKSKYQANKKWNGNNLDRISLSVKKGQKEVIKEAAKKNKQSLNKYIVDAIETRLENDELLQDFNFSKAVKNPYAAELKGVDKPDQQ